MELIDDFMRSADIDRNLGMQDYLSRKEINDYCTNNNLHTLSMSINDDSVHSKEQYGLNTTNGTKSDTIKELHVSKIPFKITDPLLEKSIVNEINFMLDTKQYNVLNDLITNSTDERKIKITRFLEQFSYLYSNNYVRLFEHRKSVVNKARKELSKIKLPELDKICLSKEKSLNKTVFIISNHDKNFIRFDMINAVSSVIGIRDWKSFISQFTKIELYISSKPIA